MGCCTWPDTITKATTGQMARRERVLRGRLGLPQGLIERVSGISAAARRGTRTRGVQ